MTNKPSKLLLVIICISSLLLFNCSKNRITDNPLIIPPNFNEMPDLNKIEDINPKIINPEIQELKDLLLKNEK